eukprot:GHVN01067193.1.p1 GENE.GHVN01067193.1~~GHVN01067193.1.p1  ORF type:complete len:2710 (+),score=348.36 GHVN01067193.1:1046-9175(+)
MVPASLDAASPPHGRISSLAAPHITTSPGSLCLDVEDSLWPCGGSAKEITESVQNVVSTLVSDLAGRHNLSRDEGLSYSIGPSASDEAALAKLGSVFQDMVAAVVVWFPSSSAVQIVDNALLSACADSSQETATKPRLPKFVVEALLDGVRTAMELLITPADFAHLQSCVANRVGADKNSDLTKVSTDGIQKLRRFLDELQDKGLIQRHQLVEFLDHDKLDAIKFLHPVGSAQQDARLPTLKALSIKERTRHDYTLVSFNTLQEHPYAYSQLVALLNRYVSSPSAVSPQELECEVGRIIGQYRLCINRALAVTLLVFEQTLGQSRNSLLPLIRIFNADRIADVVLLHLFELSKCSTKTAAASTPDSEGFKLSPVLGPSVRAAAESTDASKAKSTPSFVVAAPTHRFYRVLAVLIMDGLLDFERIYSKLTPSDPILTKLSERLSSKHNEEAGVPEPKVVADENSGSTEETDGDKSLLESLEKEMDFEDLQLYIYNLLIPKFQLLSALLDVNGFMWAERLIRHFSETLGVNLWISRCISESFAGLIEWLIQPLVLDTPGTGLALWKKILSNNYGPIDVDIDEMSSPRKRSRAPALCSPVGMAGVDLSLAPLYTLGVAARLDDGLEGEHPSKRFKNDAGLYSSRVRDSDNMSDQERSSEVSGLTDGRCPGISQCTDMNGLVGQVIPLLLYWDLGVAQSPGAANQLLELFRKLLDECQDRKRDGWSLEEQTTIENIVASLMTRVFCPALILGSSSAQLADRVWSIMKLLKPSTRYEIYSVVSHIMIPSSPLKLANDDYKRRLKNELKRMTTSRDRHITDAIGNAACGNPFGTADGLISQSVMFRNLTQLTINHISYMTPLAADVMAFGIVERQYCREPQGGDAFKPDAQSAPQALVHVSELAALFFKKCPLTDISPLVRSVVSRIEEDVAHQAYPHKLSGAFQDYKYIEDLIRCMGGVEKVDLSERSDLQIEALCGGPCLRDHVMRTGKTYCSTEEVKNSLKAKKALTSALTDPEVVQGALFGLSKLRLEVLWDSEFNGTTKSLSWLVDDLHWTLLQYLDFLSQTVSSEEYAACLGEWRKAFQYCDVATAWNIIRHAIPPIYDIIPPDTKGQQNPSNNHAKEAAWTSEMAQVSLSYLVHGAFNPVKVTAGGKAKTASILAQKSEATLLQGLVSYPSQKAHPALLGGLSLDFYLTFWRLNLSDVHVPHHIYEKEISSLKMDIHNMERLKNGLKSLRMPSGGGSSGDTSASDRFDFKRELKEIEKRLKRMNTYKTNLEREHKFLSEQHNRVMKYLKTQKDLWFGSGGETAMSAFVHHLLAPRVTSSETDALFCAHFVRVLESLETSMFCIIDFYNKWTNMIAPLVRGCTEREASLVGLFIGEMMKDVNSWVQDPDALIAFKDNRCYATKYVAAPSSQPNADGSKPVTPSHVPFDRNLLLKGVSKWENRVFRHLQPGLGVTSHEVSWIEQRTVLILLKQTLQSFPITQATGNQILEALKSVISESTKDTKQWKDISIMATRIGSFLKEKKPKWVDIPQGSGAQITGAAKIKRPLTAPPPAAPAAPSATSSASTGGTSASAASSSAPSSVPSLHSSSASNVKSTVASSSVSTTAVSKSSASTGPATASPASTAADPPATKSATRSSSQSSSSSSTPKGSSEASTSTKALSATTTSSSMASNSKGSTSAVSGAGTPKSTPGTSPSTKRPGPAPGTSVSATPAKAPATSPPTRSASASSSSTSGTSMRSGSMPRLSAASTSPSLSSASTATSPKASLSSSTSQTSSISNTSASKASSTPLAKSSTSPASASAPKGSSASTTITSSNSSSEKSSSAPASRESLAAKSAAAASPSLRIARNATTAPVSSANSAAVTSQTRSSFVSAASRSQSSSSSSSSTTASSTSSTSTAAKRGSSSPVLAKSNPTSAASSTTTPSSPAKSPTTPVSNSTKFPPSKPPPPPSSSSSEASTERRTGATNSLAPSPKAIVQPPPSNAGTSNASAGGSKKKEPPLSPLKTMPKEKEGESRSATPKSGPRDQDRPSESPKRAWSDGSSKKEDVSKAVRGDNSSGSKDAEAEKQRPSTSTLSPSVTSKIVGGKRASKDRNSDDDRSERLRSQKDDIGVGAEGGSSDSGSGRISARDREEPRQSPINKQSNDWFHRSLASPSSSTSPTSSPSTLSGPSGTRDTLDQRDVVTNSSSSHKESDRASRSHEDSKANLSRKRHRHHESERPSERERDEAKPSHRREREDDRGREARDRDRERDEQRDRKEDHRSRDREKDREREREKEREKDRDKDRERDREKDRDKDREKRQKQKSHDHPERYHTDSARKAEKRDGSSSSKSEQLNRDEQRRRKADDGGGSDNGSQSKRHKRDRERHHSDDERDKRPREKEKSQRDTEHEHERSPAKAAAETCRNEDDLKQKLRELQRRGALVSDSRVAKSPSLSVKDPPDGSSPPSKASQRAGEHTNRRAPADSNDSRDESPAGALISIPGPASIEKDMRPVVSHSSQRVRTHGADGSRTTWHREDDADEEGDNDQLSFLKGKEERVYVETSAGSSLRREQPHFDGDESPGNQPRSVPQWRGLLPSRTRSGSNVGGLNRQQENEMILERHPPPPDHVDALPRAPLLPPPPQAAHHSPPYEFYQRQPPNYPQPAQPLFAARPSQPFSMMPMGGSIQYGRMNSPQQFAFRPQMMPPAQFPQQGRPRGANQMNVYNQMQYM